MAMSEETLSGDLLKMFKGGANEQKDAADKLAKIIHDFVKSADVSVTAATGVIKVSGTAASQTNAAPIELSGSLS